MATILMMSAKMAAPALLKINIFWNKGYYAYLLSMTSPKKFCHMTQIIL